MLTQQSMNEKSSKILRHLVSLCENDKRGYRKLNDDDSYMPVTVEKLHSPKKDWKVITVCHYGEMNGDLMRDPEMLFLVSDEKCLPYSYRNDYAGYWQELTDIYDRDISLSSIRRSDYRSMKEFAEMWMDNIMDQQNLEIE